VAQAEVEAEREEEEADRRKAIQREAKRVEREAAELDAMTGASLEGDSSGEKLLVEEGDAGESSVPGSEAGGESVEKLAEE
jgi:hypothetical protein